MFGMGTGVTLSVRSPETFELAAQGTTLALRATPPNLGGEEAVDNSILMGKFEREK